MITVTNARVVGKWDEKDLYEGAMSGHPAKEDGFWAFTITQEKGKRFIPHRNRLGEIQQLEVEFK